MKMIIEDEGNTIEWDLPDWIDKLPTEAVAPASIGWLLMEREFPCWSTPKFMAWPVSPGKMVGFSFLAPEHQGAHRFDPMFWGFTQEEVKEITASLRRTMEELDENGIDYLSLQAHQAKANALFKAVGLPGEANLPELPGIEE